MCNASPVDNPPPPNALGVPVSCEQKCLSQAPENSFDGVQSAVRVRETVPVGRTSKSAAAVRTESVTCGTCSGFRSAEQRYLWLDSGTQQSGRFMMNVRHCGFTEGKVYPDAGCIVFMQFTNTPRKDKRQKRIFYC